MPLQAPRLAATETIATTFTHVFMISPVSLIEIEDAADCATRANRIAARRLSPYRRAPLFGVSTALQKCRHVSYAFAMQTARQMDDLSVQKKGRHAVTNRRQPGPLRRRHQPASRDPARL